MMDSKSYIIRVTGIVQGVGFRYYTLRKAQELGLFGFAKNIGDGSVYMEIEGPENECNQFIGWCQQGPPRARVERVDVQESPNCGFTEFSIR